MQVTRWVFILALMVTLSCCLGADRATYVGNLAVRSESPRFH
jgi:hypothetical protein